MARANGAGGGNRPIFDTEAAFAYWYALPYEERRYHRVADHFNIAIANVKEVAKPGRGDWQARAKTLDAKAAKIAVDKSVRDKAKMLADALEIDDLANKKLRRLLKSGKLDVDLPGVARWAQHVLLLMGEATDRTDGHLEVSHLETDAAAERVRAKLAEVIELRPARAAASGDSNGNGRPH